MPRTELQSEIIAALQNSPRDVISERTLRGAVNHAGVDASVAEFDAACMDLVEEGELDLEYRGSSRRYRLSEMAVEE